MTTSRQKRNNVFDCVRSTIGPVLCVILGLALFATMLTAFVTLAGCGSDEIADDDDVVATIETMSHSAPSHQRVVQYGDSLWTIAAEEHVDWLQLAAVNRTYLVAIRGSCSQLRATATPARLVLQRRRPIRGRTRSSPATCSRSPSLCPQRRHRRSGR